MEIWYCAKHDETHYGCVHQKDCPSDYEELQVEIPDEVWDTLSFSQRQEMITQLSAEQ